MRRKKKFREKIFKEVNSNVTFSLDIDWLDINIC